MLIADIDGDDGVIDYEEFVRFAVVMFQAFRARNFGQKRADEDYVAMTVEIDKMMKVQRLAEVSERCMKMFRMHDTAGSGYLRPSEVHRAMDEAGGGLSPWEVGCKPLSVTGLGSAHRPPPLTSFLPPRRLILQAATVRKGLPRDGFGRVGYAGFPQLLESVRFLSLKREMMERRSGPVLSALIAECQRIEQDNYVPTSLRNLDKKDFLADGVVDMRQLAHLCGNTPHLEHLSYLQAAILLSSADISDDGKMDYYDVLPTVIHGYNILMTPENKAQAQEMLKVASLHFNISALVRVYTHQVRCTAERHVPAACHHIACNIRILPFYSCTGVDDVGDAFTRRCRGVQPRLAGGHGPG